MLKKLFLFALALFFSVQPVLAHAVDLGSAFDNLLGPGAAVGVNKPGRYQSGARNSFVAGGLEMRVPRGNSAPQLMSVTPPRIVAGCNGISAHFGGFSFISGAEFELMLKTIASGAALGFVSMMTLKILCPPCEAVVQFLKTAAQQAARLAKDACQWGRDMASKFAAGMSSDSNPESVCGTTIMAGAGSHDFLQATNDACNGLRSAIDSLLGENTDPNKPGSRDADKDQATKCEAGGAGNRTWARLRSFDVEGTVNSTTTVPDPTSEGYLRKIILMNLLGAEMYYAGTKSDPNATSTDVASSTVGCEVSSGPPTQLTENNPHAYCTPPIDSAGMVGLFLCGAPSDSGVLPGEPGDRVKEYCNTMIKTEGADKTLASQLYICDDKDLIQCSYLHLTSASNVFKGPGFLTTINKTLLAGVEAIRKNEAMPADVLRLMQVAPFPLYQAMNAAAVYPAAAIDLIDSMSILVAEQVTIAYLDDLLRMPGRQSSANKANCLTQAQAQQILTHVSSLRAANFSRKQQIAQNISVQEALSEQIRQINLAIQKQVMNQDMLSNARFGQQVNNYLSPNVAKPADSTGGTSTTPATPTTP